MSDESPREKSADETSIVMLDKEIEDTDDENAQILKFKESLKKISDEFQADEPHVCNPVFPVARLCFINFSYIS